MLDLWCSKHGVFTHLVPQLRLKTGTDSKPIVCEMGKVFKPGELYAATNPTERRSLGYVRHAGEVT